MSTTAIKERPILFSGPMVRAILDGRKTMTRRVVKPQPVFGNGLWEFESDKPMRPDGDLPHNVIRTNDPASLSRSMATVCPYGQPGDRLWVRETWADVNTEDGPALMYAANSELRFCSDDAYPVEYHRYPKCQFSMWWSDLRFRKERDCESYHHWRPSIYMPRWASRITLELTDVRVQRLQEITSGGYMFKSDIQQEGCPFDNDPAKLGADEAEWFMKLWDSINGDKHPWASNPWVWAITFRRVTT